MKTLSMVILFAFLNCIMGCAPFFKIAQQPELKSWQAEKLNDVQSSHYIILRYQDSEGSWAWHITELNFKNDTIYVTLDPWLDYHIKYLKPKKDRKNRYKRNEPRVIDEIHLFTSDTIAYDATTANIPINSIYKTKIYEYDKKAVKGNKLRTTGVIVGTAVGVLAIIAATSSCPFIHIDNGDNFEFVGEIYGGAANPATERHDYMPLPGLQAVDGQYVLRISNELEEVQNTNLCELVKLTHPSNTRALIDKYGRIFTFTSPQPPVSAIALNDHNFTVSVSEKDNDYFRFNEYTNKTTVNSLILTFNKQGYPATGKLIVNAKNSSWADYAYGEFTKLMGTYYKKWYEKQKSVPYKEHVEGILKQDVPLSVYLETDRGWEFVDYFHSVGPFATRDMIMPIDLTDHQVDEVRIKLETGYMFWELDQAAMDFSKDCNVQATVLKPRAALDENGQDVTSLIRYDDNLYLVQPEVGNRADITYSPVTAANIQFTETIILHTKGYYERIADYTNRPNWFKLISFIGSHSFSKYSWKFYQQIREQNEEMDLTEIVQK